MKLNVKTLRGTSFEIEASPGESVSEVKKIIETTQGPSVYPADRQMLMYQGKFLKDDTTLEGNKVAENSFLLIMLSKAKASSSGASTATAGKAPATPIQSAAPAAAPVASVARPTSPQAPVDTAETEPPSVQPSPAAAAAAAPAATVAASGDADVYSQAALNHVSRNNLEQTIQQILDIGGGTWERDTGIGALRAAYNNPEREIDYLYCGIPENVEAPPVARAAPASGQQTNMQAPSPAQPAVAPPVQPSAASAEPNANPLNLFSQFQALLQLVQANPQILQNEPVTTVACVASATTTPACQAPVAAAPSQVSSNTSTSNLDYWGWEDSDDETDWEDSDDETDWEDSDDETHEDPSIFDMERLPSDLLQKIISFTSPLDALHIAMFPHLRQDAYSNIVWDSFLRSFKELNEERVDLDHQLAIISAATPSMTVREKFGRLFEPKFVADQSMTVWLDKETCAKCYMLVARTLLVANQSSWMWIRCDRLRPPLVAAELLPRTNQLEISGTMPSTLLSQRSTYAAYMVFKIKVESTLLNRAQESAVSIGEYRDTNVICFGDVYGCELPRKRRDGWMEVKLGEFSTEDGDDSQLHIQVILNTGDQLMKGLSMLGIEIRVAKWRASWDASDHEKS